MADSYPGAEGVGKGAQDQTASKTPATPSAEQAGSNEAKAPPTEAIVAEQSTPDVAEPTQTGDGAVHSAVPDAPAEQSTSSCPISSEADNTQAPESIPPNDAADPEARNAPKASLISLADSPLVPPPVPAKEAAVVNMPGPTSQETSTSSLQTTDPAASETVNPDNVDETGVPSLSGDAVAATNGDNPDPEGVAEEPTAQSGADHSHATYEGTSAPQGEDAKSEGPPKLTLPMDRVRQLSTATDMFSSSAESPADETGSPSVHVEEEGGAGEPGTPGKPKKKRKPKKRSGERNSLRPASGATGNDVDKPTKQDTKHVIPDPVDIPGAEGDGVLVKADSSGDDSAVFVDALQAVTSGPAAGNDEREVLHN